MLLATVVGQVVDGFWVGLALVVLIGGTVRGVASSLLRQYKVLARCGDDLILARSSWAGLRVGLPVSRVGPEVPAHNRGSVVTVGDQRLRVSIVDRGRADRILRDPARRAATS